MSLWRALTRNWADTDEPGDPTLTPLDWPVPVTEALSRLPAITRTLPGWRVEAVDPTAGTLAVTRRTRLFRFVDDMTIRLEPTPSGTRVHARSKSRVGAADFGQNRRNLLELFRAIRDAGESPSAPT